LQITIKNIRSCLDNFNSNDAANYLIDMIEGLSNWYIRRNRERFWATGFTEDKINAYATLYETLLTLSKLIAPFVPFFAEEMYQNLSCGKYKESVHLDFYPEQIYEIDETLESDMFAVRDIISLGLKSRAVNKIQITQPLEQMDVVFNDKNIMLSIEKYKQTIK